MFGKSRQRRRESLAPSGPSHLGFLTSFLSPGINQLSEICGTDEPRRFLTAQAERAAGQLLRRRAAPSFGAAEAEVFRCDTFERNIGFAEFGQQTKECAVHSANLRSFSYALYTAPPFSNSPATVSPTIPRKLGRCGGKPICARISREDGDARPISAC